MWSFSRQNSKGKAFHITFRCHRMSANQMLPSTYASFSILFSSFCPVKLQLLFLNCKLVFREEEKERNYLLRSLTSFCTDFCTKEERKNLSFLPQNIHFSTQFLAQSLESTFKTNHPLFCELIRELNNDSLGGKTDEG